MRLTLTKKLRIVMIVMAAIVFISPLIILRTLSKRKEDVKKIYDSTIETITYKKLNIVTSDGLELFSDGSFSDDETVRRAFFHIIGDMNDGIRHSVISAERKNAVIEDKESHRYFNDVNIELTVSSELQKAAYKTLEDYYDSNGGAIVVLNYKTGEIKALSSYPSLDVENIDYIPEESYLNKPLCKFVPGSVFKAISVAAVLEKNPQAKNFSYKCTSVNGHVSCMGIHGESNLSKLIYKSCNCGICQFVSKNLHADELDEFVINKMRLTDTHQIAELPCDEGNIDSASDIRWTANGQAKDLLTPVAVARFYGILANEGFESPLHIFTNTEVEQKQMLSKKTALFISKALEPVVGNALPVKAFGKTGTAQLGKDVTSHAWFVCSLTDSDAPPYTVLVMLENGGSSLNAKQVCFDFINNEILND